MKPVAWQAPSGRDFITIVRMPSAIMTAFSMPATNRALSAMFPKMLKEILGTHAPAISHFASTTVALCGSPAYVMTTHSRSGGTQEFILEGSGLAIIYSYAATETESHFLHAFCPAASADITTLSPPAGWRIKPMMHPVAEWYGPAMGEMLIESQGPVMPSLEAAWALAGSSRRTVTSHVGSTSLRASRNLVKQTCGAQALEATTTVHIGTMHVLTDTLVVQGATSSYSIAYTTRNGSPDQGVLAAMHSFCPQ